MILLGGDAGIGKTRLVAEIRERIANDGTRVLAGACLEYAQAPLGPFIDVLREVGGFRAYRAGTKRQQFAGIATALRTAAAEHPCIVIIEDLQWADQASLELLRYLAGELTETRLLFLVTYRADELNRQHPATEAVAKLLRLPATHGIVLRPFSAAETNALVRGLLADGEQLGFPALARITALAEGNPLFVEELLRDALARSSAAPSSGDLPATLRELVLERLRLLPEEDQRVLVHAALLGREFDAQFLSGIVERGIDEVRDVLRRARGLQLIVETSGETVSYTVRHALTREALCSELLAEEARALHARVVVELEARHPDRVHRLAYHAWSARDAGKAVRYNVAAGDSAIAMLAFGDAVVLYERAAEFCPEPSPTRAEIHEKTADALWMAGWSREATRHAKAARSDYEACGDLESAARACYQLSQHCFAACDRDGAMAAILAAAETIRRVPDSSQTVAILSMVSRQLGRLGDLDGARHFVDEAQSSGDVEALGAAWCFLHARGLVHCMAGDPDASLADLRRALECVPAGDDDAALVTLTNLAAVTLEFGLDDLSAEYVADARRVSRDRFPLNDLYTLGLGAEGAVQLGRYDRAVGYLMEAAPSLAAVEFPGFMFAKLTAAALRLSMRMNRPDLAVYVDADRMLESSFKSGGSEFITEMASAFVERYAHEGRLDAAAVLLHRAIPAIGHGIARSRLLLLAAGYAGSADVAAARASLASWARPNNALGIAHRALFDATAAARAGDRATARAHAVDAAERYLQLNRPYERALALEAGGDAVSAYALYEAIGDVRDAQRLRGSALGVNRRGRARDELTNRERQISRLIAEGKSNRAVAAELVISERTVEKHVEAILGKLGYTSRTELAARAGERGSSTSAR